MSLSNSEKNDIKQKAKTYLEKSIYTLSLIVGVSPETALTATTKEDLSNGVSQADNKEEAIESLYNNILNYRAIG